MSDDRWNPWQRPPREVLIDRQIREAMEAGKFDDLPFQGQRIPLEDDSAAGEWAQAFRMLRNARMAPPWIEADKDARRQLAGLEALISEARGAGALGHGWRRRRLAAIVAAVNRAIEVLNVEAPTDRQHRRVVDLSSELRRLEAAEAGGDPGPSGSARSPRAG